MNSLCRVGVLVGIVAVTMFAAVAESSQRPAGPRRVVSLDGTWQAAEGSLDKQPAKFDRTVPVPGLVDMAEPAFREVGRRSPLRQAFWYRRTFRVDGPCPPRRC